MEQNLGYDEISVWYLCNFPSVWVGISEVKCSILFWGFLNTVLFRNLCFLAFLLHRFKF